MVLANTTSCKDALTKYKLECRSSLKTEREETQDVLVTTRYSPCDSGRHETVSQSEKGLGSTKGLSVSAWSAPVSYHSPKT